MWNSFIENEFCESVLELSEADIEFSDVGYYIKKDNYNFWYWGGVNRFQYSWIKICRNISDLINIEVGIYFEIRPNPYSDETNVKYFIDAREFTINKDNEKKYSEIKNLELSSHFKKILLESRILNLRLSKKDKSYVGNFKVNIKEEFINKCREKITEYIKIFSNYFE